MNSDLISRDALKKAFEKVYPLSTNEMGGVVNKRIYEIIYNAPTVEPVKQCKYCKHCGNEDHCSNCHSDHSLFEYYERPQGEWIDYNAYYKTCSICKRTVGIDFLIQKYESTPKYSFCPNCGAKMI